MSIPKYYSTITGDPLGDNQEQHNMESIGLWNQFQNKIFQIKLCCIDNSRMCCMTYQNYICILLSCVILLFVIYVVIILVGLFCVLFDILFEKTMVYFIGQTLYNKSFPICTDTMYRGGECYTTTNTYCR